MKSMAKYDILLLERVSNMRETSELLTFLEIVEKNLVTYNIYRKSTSVRSVPCINTFKIMSNVLPSFLGRIIIRDHLIVISNNSY